MSKVDDFFIGCWKCEKLGLVNHYCNVAWHPRNRLLIKCYVCGHTEVVLCKDKTPQTKEELIKQVRKGIDIN